MELSRPGLLGGRGFTGILLRAIAMFATWPPKFEPVAGLRSGHQQTLAAYCSWAPIKAVDAVAHCVTLPDGDAVVLHDDCPERWQPGDPVAVLVPGLGGCHKTPYLARVAAKLVRRGVRTFRMDQRGFGAAANLNRLPQHAGRSEDVASALERVGELTDESPIALVGFSLGGNIVLKLAGEAPGELPGNVTSLLAVNPPVDLAALIARLDHPSNYFYQRYFMHSVLRGLVRRHRQPSSPDQKRACFGSTHEFNERFLAPLCGFRSAAHFYDECSSVDLLPAIERPTLILTSRDDPLVPAEAFEYAILSASTWLVMTDHGGHLGYLGRAKPRDPDARWLDWRVVDWVTEKERVMRMLRTRNYIRSPPKPVLAQAAAG